MEVLSINSLSTLSLHEADDRHQLGNKLYHHLETMAGRSHVSNIHRLCNDEIESNTSGASLQTTSPGQIMRQLPLPPYQLLSLPRLPGIREVSNFWSENVD